MLSIYIGTIHPRKSEPKREPHAPRTWVAGQLQATPGPWEQECKTLRQEVARLGIVIGERDAAIASLKVALGAARLLHQEGAATL